MLASTLAEELARKWRDAGGPIAVPPDQVGKTVSQSPTAQETVVTEPPPNTSKSDGKKERPRRFTPYGPTPIQFDQSVTEQISAIQRQQHTVASHDYFLTAPEYRGTAEKPKVPTGIWGFDKADVDRYPVLKKRNFFCIQHHQATGKPCFARKLFI